MTVSAVEATPGPFGVEAGATSTTSTTSADKDMFLQLLVAQMRNQDPANPQDSSEFLAQTAQFSMVEKLEEIAKQGAEALASTRNLTAAGMIGRKLTERLIVDRALGGQPIEKLTLIDIVAPARPASRVSSEMPANTTSNFDHVVTQWMSPE